MDSIQTLARVLTHRGYAIRKDTLTTEELTQLRKDLTVSPLINAKFAAAANQTSFPVFYESPQRIYLPRQWGLLKYGVPQGNLLSEGSSLPSTASFSGKPYDYQLDIIDKFLKAGGNGLICVPCGKGKTFMALAIAARLGKRFCIVVDKEFLLNQWKGEIETFFPGLRVGIFQGDLQQTQPEVIVGKAKTIPELKALAKEAGLRVGGTREELVKRLQEANIDTSPTKEIREYDCTICMIQTIIQKDLPGNTFIDYGFTIFDECHHLGASHFSKALMKIQTKWMLGLSATPTRDDGLSKVFEWFLGTPVYWEKTREPDATVSVLSLFYKSNDPDYGEVPVDWKGDVVMARLLGKVVEYRPRTERIAEILKLWIQETPDRRILVLSERISHLEVFEELLRPLNVPIGYYIGGMKDEDRDATAANARIILATYAMASEAMNIKTLNAVALVSPRKKVEQSTGRILRIRPEQRSLEHRILDVVDQHDLYTGQWRKRLSYYKQCHYKIYQVNETNERVALHQPKVQEVSLSGCAIADD